jgi:hypothetical protein
MHTIAKSAINAGCRFASTKLEKANTAEDGSTTFAALNPVVAAIRESDLTLAKQAYEMAHSVLANADQLKPQAFEILKQFDRYFAGSND